jgi:hypothetical protein
MLTSAYRLNWFINFKQGELCVINYVECIRKDKCCNHFGSPVTVLFSTHCTSTNTY